MIANLLLTIGIFLIVMAFFVVSINFLTNIFGGYKYQQISEKVDKVVENKTIKQMDKTVKEMKEREENE